MPHRRRTALYTDTRSPADADLPRHLPDSFSLFFCPHILQTGLHGGRSQVLSFSVLLPTQSHR